MAKKKDRTNREKYGIIDSDSPGFPFKRALLRVPHQGLEEGLVVSRDLFDGGPFYGNPDSECVDECLMDDDYRHPITKKLIKFRLPTTSETISALAFEDVLQSCEILQAGYTISTLEGIYVNPPQEQGKPQWDERMLKSLRDKSKTINGIWILENGAVEGVRDFGFAPYESFEMGRQDCLTFARGGLARLLEHSSENVARNLLHIASSEDYCWGVLVKGESSLYKFSSKLKGPVETSLNVLFFSNLEFIGHVFSIYQYPLHIDHWAKFLNTVRGGGRKALPSYEAHKRKPAYGVMINDD